MTAKNDMLRCRWKPSRVDDSGNVYVTCTVCGRSKREDIPDVQPCAGGRDSHLALMRRIVGDEMTEDEICRTSKESHDGEQEQDRDLEEHDDR